MSGLQKSCCEETGVDEFEIDAKMNPTFILAGKLTRDYLLPPSGSPLLDSPGGSLLYAAGGLSVWDSNIGLLARIKDDYPKPWLEDLKKRGFNIQGIRVHPDLKDAEMRSFTAYTEKKERSHSNAVSHFARHQLTFPKSLLGYQSQDESKKNPRETDLLSPSTLEVPREYRDAGYVHLCPFDFNSQSQMVSLFRSASNQVVTLDPSPGFMSPPFWRDLRIVLQGVIAFHPSEEEIRALFWGETNDLWEMADKLCEFGPQVVVIKRGALGQLVFDSAAKKRYEIPAYSSRVADPTGAGDAFCGGFLAGLHRTNDPFMAALYGNVSASLKVEGSGPFYPLDVMPGLAEARLHALKEVARAV